jgi:Right handed beta helix region
MFLVLLGTQTGLFFSKRRETAMNRKSSVLKKALFKVWGMQVGLFCLLVSLSVTGGAARAGLVLADGSGSPALGSSVNTLDPAVTVHRQKRVDVMDFGADPSGSAAENARALQTAINSGVAVVDLGGKRYLSDQLVLRSDLELRNGTLIMTSTAGFQYGALLWADGLENLTLDGLTLVQDSGLPLKIVRRGVVFRNCSKVTVKNSTFKDWNDQAIRFQETHDFKVLGNALSNCNRNSANTSADATDDYGAIALFANCSGGQIGFNRISGGGTGISVYGGPVTGGSSQIEIFKNNLSGDEHNVSGMGIYCLKHVSEVSISGNSVSGYFNEGIVLVNTDKTNGFTVENVSIENNAVENNKYAQISVQKGGAAQIFRNIKISGNSVGGPNFSTRGGHGIITQNDNSMRGTFAGLSVSNNTISTRQTSSTPFAIWMQQSSGSSVSGNRISGTWTRQVWDDRQTGTSYSGNTLAVASGRTGLVVTPSGDMTSPNRYHGNRIHGIDATSVLITKTGAGKISGESFVGNIFQTGVVAADFTQKPIADANTFEGVSSSGMDKRGLNPRSGVRPD